jgi:hypothetical protein
MISRQPLGFAITAVVGITAVVALPGPMEVKMAAIAALGPLTGAAGGIAPGRQDVGSPVAPCYAPPRGEKPGH